MLGFSIHLLARRRADSSRTTDPIVAPTWFVEVCELYQTISFPIGIETARPVASSGPPIGPDACVFVQAGSEIPRENDPTSRDPSSDVTREYLSGQALDGFKIDTPLLPTTLIIMSFSSEGAREAPDSVPPTPIGGGSLDETTEQRYEVKFWATEEQAGEILRLCAPYLEVDPFCQTGPQRNISLYLDSPLRTFFENHVAGAPSRFKLRVRTYEDPHGPAFLEVKHRFKSVTSKRRVSVPRSAARELVGGRMDAVAGLPSTPALNEFLYLHQRYMAEPVLLISARRLGLRGINDEGRFRLTLDRDIRYQRHCDTDLTGRLGAWSPLDVAARSGNPALRVLVEAKFVDAAPGWLAATIEQLRLRSTSFSKYIAAMYQDMAENDGGMQQMMNARTDDEDGE